MVLPPANVAPSVASANEMINAKVACGFTVTSREMPAGDYEVVGDELPKPGTCRLRANDGACGEIAITESIESHQSPRLVRL
jgi:hypothetical protein